MKAAFVNHRELFKELFYFLPILKVLPHDSKARRLFVTSGGLKKVQEIKAEPGSAIQEYINAVNSCYPEEIVRFMNIYMNNKQHHINIFLN